jgi:poly(A)-specific ribonuclease
LKSKYNADNFRIIQLGISCFIKNKNNEKEYIAKPYNIYVFPSEKINNGKFDFYIESIIFNRDHGCDFNKWIKKGVSYLNEENLNKLVDRTINGDINKYNPNDIYSFKNIALYKEKDKIIYDEFLNKFNSFFNNQDEKFFKHEKINKHLVLYFLNLYLFDLYIK